jgi:hypothetical protein
VLITIGKNSFAMNKGTGKKGTEDEFSDLSRTTVAGPKLYQIRTTIIALTLTVSGLALIMFNLHLVPDLVVKGVAKDLGIAVVISGLIAFAHGYIFSAQSQAYVSPIELEQFAQADTKNLQEEGK